MLLSLALCVAPSTNTLESPFKKCLWIGYAIQAYGDWNKDGRPDFLVSAPSGWSRGIEATVALVSGKDGLGLLSLHGKHGFGSTLAVLGDVDCDSYPEIVVGGEDSGWRTRVFSGRSGEELYSIAGSCAVDVPDENGDAIPDLVLWTIDAESSVSPMRVSFLSGVDGKPIRSFAAPYGDFIRIPDCNGDGLGDFVISHTSTWRDSLPSARLEVVSGRDGAVLGQRAFEVQCMAPRIAFANTGELGADGRLRIVVSFGYDTDSDWIDGRHAPIPAGTVNVLTVPSLATAFELEAKNPQSCNGYSLAAGFDIDGDGHRDILVTEYPDLFEGLTAHLRIYSGSDGALIRGQNGGQNFGRTVNWIGDIDGDGVTDYAVASLYDRDPTSYDLSDHVTAYSGKGGERLGTLMNESFCCELTWAELIRSK